MLHLTRNDPRQTEYSKISMQGSPLVHQVLSSWLGKFLCAYMQQWFIKSYLSVISCYGIICFLCVCIVFTLSGVCFTIVVSKRYPNEYKLDYIHVYLYFLQGGIKAVIWTDVFQSLVMLAGMLSILIKVHAKSIRHAQKQIQRRLPINTVSKAY